ncbi:MAG TPA: hypothetical protein VG225_14000 [Terracidiphilus sp.]|jgi:hypothetical protein|nr:hypothetical protein [Terracidiphilus sp.]
MKIGSIRLSGASIALLVLQLAIVSSIAAKYLYQRWTCPRVWTRTAAYDPELVMRGRYLSLQLMVDGCESTLPSGKQAEFPRNADGTIRSQVFTVRGSVAVVEFPARLVVKDHQLMAVHVRDAEDPHDSLTVSAWEGTACDQMRLTQPVNFYISEHAQSPVPVKRGDELWIEVTVPPKGPPRPIQLALKQGGAWKPLAFQ